MHGSWVNEFRKTTGHKLNQLTLGILAQNLLIPRYQNVQSRA